VHPWAIVQRLGIWYLVAMCEAAGQERVFRMDRIRAIEHTGQLFVPPSEVPLAVTPDASTLPVAEIRFAPDSRLPDERSWPGVTFQKTADGSTLVRMPYQSPPWIARRVVAYLGFAEVLRPTEVRDAVHALAEETLRSIL
jgi:predicted DNA-binding transcriptional regulator YafY